MMSQISQSLKSKAKAQNVLLHTKDQGLPDTSEVTFKTYDALLSIGGADPRVAEARAMLQDAETDWLVERAIEQTQKHFAWDPTEVTGSNTLAGDTTYSCTPDQKRWRILLYAPLYVWNQCINHCKYCGFNSTLDIEREVLDEDRAVEESDMLTRWGIRHQLLVAGEFPRFEKEGRLERIAERLMCKGVIPSAEVAPRSVEGYQRLVDAGVGGLIKGVGLGHR